MKKLNLSFLRIGFRRGIRFCVNIKTNNLAWICSGLEVKKVSATSKKAYISRRAGGRIGIHLLGQEEMKVNREQKAKVYCISYRFLEKAGKIEFPEKKQKEAAKMIAKYFK